MLRASILCLVLTACALGSQVQKNERIHGGMVAADGAYPFTCSLRNRGDHECGCVILSANHVLTAASCTNVALTGWVSAHVGSNHVNAGGAQYQADKINKHPDYVENVLTSVDLAVITLKDPLVLGEKVAVATLPAQGDPTDPDTAGTVLGWGFTTSVGPISPDLLEAPQTVMDNADCLLLVPGLITDGNICTDGADAGICRRDAGGPLLVDSVVHGIVAWTSSGQCSSAGSPVVYTRVSMYRDWIDSIVGAV